jgi:glycosidase
VQPARYVFVFLAVAAVALAEPRPWTHEVMYFALTDRFFDGDPANNVPPGCDPATYDAKQQDIAKYHGGDLRGVEIAIQRGYFRALGVTTLWLTPPVRNVWNSLADLGGAKTGYHGYWTQDFLDIDPHWTSATSLDGKTPYPDTRDGRMQHYRDFVAHAHANGLRVVQDVVLNHAGPVFFYDADGDEKFDTAERAEWIQPFRRSGFHANARWADEPQWNARRTAPDGPQTVLGAEVKTTGVLADLATYGRKGFSDDSLGKNDGEEIECDFFALRDLWTAPGSPHFDRLVDEFVEIYAFYIEQIGIDALRVDTVKHVHHAFWDAFTQRLRQRVGEARAKSLLIFGEVYDGSATAVGRYTYRSDWPENTGICFDSLLNFPFCFAVREYLRPSIGPFDRASAVEKAWISLNASTDEPRRPKFNRTAGPDGRDARKKLINFVENHDGLNRFRVPPVSEKQNLLANAFVLLSEGIPCLYYGTESSLTDSQGKVGRDSETGRLTFIPRGKPENLEAILQTASFRALSALAKLRADLPALRDGVTSPLWADAMGSDSDDGVFAFARYLREEDAAPGSAVVVVINASERPRATSAGQTRMRLVTRSGRPLIREGAKLTRLPVAGIDNVLRETTLKPVWHDGVPQIELLLEPQTVNIYRVD